MAYDLTTLDAKDFQRMKGGCESKNPGSFEKHLCELICTYADDVNARLLVRGINPTHGYLFQDWLERAERIYGPKK